MKNIPHQRAKHTGVSEEVGDERHAAHVMGFEQQGRLEHYIIAATYK